MTACSFAVSAHVCWNWAVRAAQTAIPLSILGRTLSTCRSLDMRRLGYIPKLARLLCNDSSDGCRSFPRRYKSRGREDEPRTRHLRSLTTEVRASTPRLLARITSRLPVLQKFLEPIHTEPALLVL